MKNTLEKEPVRNVMEQVPPFDEPTERAVLGSMMVAKEAAQIAVDMLAAEDFYVPRHRWLFAEFVRIFSSTGSLEELLVSRQLCRKTNDTDKQYSLKDFLGRLVLEAPSAANIETYCRVVKAEWTKRQLVEAAGLTLKSVQEGCDAGEIAAQVSERMQLLQAPPERTQRPMDAVRQQVADEIADKRGNIEWPGFPRISSTLCFMPGSLTVVCGSPGASKSFWLIEMIWRLAFNGVSCAILELEKNIEFHLRRAMAQIAEKGEYLDPRWVKDNADKCAEIEAKYGHLGDRLSDNGNIQELNCPKTATNILRWISNECRNGRKILVIDSISAMASTYEETNDDQKRIVNEGMNIVTRYGARLVHVLHPRKLTGKMLVPEQGNIKGSAALSELTDTIFWLEAHGHDTERFSPPDRYGDEKETHEMRKLREPLPYNRTVHLLKTRLCKPRPKKLAVFNNGGNLWHTERGWL